MRNKRYVSGLNNSQKIRVIVNGVGFVTTVAGVFDMCITSQRIAVTLALQTIGSSETLTGKPITGIGRTYNVYDHDNKIVDVGVQVDLI